MKAENAQRAVELAESLQRGEQLSATDRDWLANVIYQAASDALQRPSANHRPAMNMERDYWATMDRLETNDKLDEVAARWGIEDGKQLSTIMSRNGGYWRKECENFRAANPGLITKPLIEMQRRQILLQKSKSSEV